jgi:hypothetical protein
VAFWSKWTQSGRKRPFQSWATFLRGHADGIAAADPFVVPFRPAPSQSRAVADDINNLADTSNDTVT